MALAIFESPNNLLGLLVVALSSSRCLKFSERSTFVEEVRITDKIDGQMSINVHLNLD